MTYKKPRVNEYKDAPVFAGACGDYTSSCGASVHRKGANTACGDYTSSCGASVHRKTGNMACGDFTSSCGAKVHRK